MRNMLFICCLRLNVLKKDKALVEQSRDGKPAKLGFKAPSLRIRRYLGTVTLAVLGYVPQLNR
ncbi:MAG TPA: hypothetical protein V6C78_30670 [Crinalium sp.]|jgi:hypothetical protein